MCSFPQGQRDFLNVTSQRADLHLFDMLPQRPPPELLQHEPWPQQALALLRAECRDRRTDATTPVALCDDDAGLG